MADMTRIELVRAVARRASLTLDQADQAIRVLAEVAIEEMGRGHGFRLFGLGKLIITQRKATVARVLRGPNVGQSVSVPARKAVLFRPQTPLLRAVRGE
jgi:nucleoid DNA-binding protein